MCWNRSSRPPASLAVVTAGTGMFGSLVNPTDFRLNGRNARLSFASGSMYQLTEWPW